MLRLYLDMFESLRWNNPELSNESQSPLMPQSELSGPLVVYALISTEETTTIYIRIDKMVKLSELYTVK